MNDWKTLENNLINRLITIALLEDSVNEDITTNSLLDFDKEVFAIVSAKEDGIISGIDVFSKVFQTLDKDIDIKVFFPDGSKVKKGDEVLSIRGKESSILKGERTALNFLQRLSGIASLTGKFADKLKPYRVTLLDTRKTTPGMRYLEKKAVKDGGGTNHRMNLEDMAMIKDNHIAMAGSITNAVTKIRARFGDKKIEVEVKNLIELDEALSLNIDMIMLDNFPLDLLKEIVNRKKPGDQVKFEISGNVTLENIDEKMKGGLQDCIDFISVGALTHSFKSLDLSLNILDKEIERDLRR